MRGWAAVAVAGTLVAIAWIGSACSNAASDVAVDLRTDLVPGREFAAVSVELYSGTATTGAPEQTRLEAVLATFDYLRGVRVADFLGVSSGQRTLRVALLDTAGAVVAERLRRLEVRGDVVVVVVIPRDCLDASCPEDPECTIDDDCTVAAACARAQCVESSCLIETIPGTCGPDDLCDPELGCRPIGGGDAGPPPDTGPVDAGCTADDQCPPATIGEWGECVWDGPCDEHSARERQVTTWSCLGGACVETTDTEREDCDRGTNGDSCSDDEWCDGEELCAGGDCRAGFTRPCEGVACIAGCDEGSDACMPATAGTACTYMAGGFPMTGACMSGICCRCAETNLCTTGAGEPGCRNPIAGCVRCSP